MAPTWIIETHLNDACEAIAAAATAAGHRVMRWSDGDPVERVARPIFLGSLTACPHMPGVQGDPERLRVAHWLPLVGDLALNGDVMWTTAGAVDASAPWPRVFVRPDSAMKPFAGRVVEREALSPAAIDLGFYFDDPGLSVVLAEAVTIDAEWRFVAVDGRLVADSGYRADAGRAGYASTAPAGAIDAAERALAISPEPTVVIDICALPGGAFRLVEYNLFSGADLYACDPAAIVAAFG